MLHIDNYSELFSFSKKLINLAEKENLHLRIFGSVAVKINCYPSGLPDWVSLPIKDIDLIAKSEQLTDVHKFMIKLQFDLKDNQFSNYGERRTYVSSLANYSAEVQLDIYFGYLIFNHKIPKPYFNNNYKYTIPLTQLFLSKLLIVHITEKDIKDIISILRYHEISISKCIDKNILETVWCNGYKAWELSRTCKKNLATVKDYLNSNEIPYGNHKVLVNNRLDQLLGIIRQSNKSLLWKLRACIGEKMSYYNEAYSNS